MLLDVPTLFVVVTVVALLMAFWVGVMAWGQPAGGALWAWALALLTFGLGNVVYGVREHLPPGLRILLGNGCNMAALALMLLSLRRFQGVVLNRWIAWGPVLVVPPLLVLLMEVHSVRTVLAASVTLAQMGLILHALFDRAHPMPGRGRYMMLAAFGGLGLVLLARAIGIALGWVDLRSAVDRELWQGLIFVTAICALISVALGFVYMTMERAERLNFELAMKDTLTGLSNRRAINDELQRAVAQAQRQGQLLGVLMLDIDHFKRVNDSYGHQAGDVVLRSVAQLLRGRLRAQDQIGRFGGEEFLVLLPDTGLEGALTLAEALRAAVEASPTQWGAHRFSSTISIGVRAGRVGGGDTADGIVAAADAALYRAKQGGRNRVEQAESSADSRLAEL